MVNPINGDKSIAVTTERSGESAHNRRSERASATPSAPAEPNAAEQAGTTLEVEGARQLYNLENQAARVSGAEITSPEAARSVLDQLLEQISTRPEQALQAQGTDTKAPLAKLLQTAPA